MERQLEDLRKENLWYKIRLEDVEKKLQEYEERERLRQMEKELS